MSKRMFNIAIILWISLIYLLDNLSIFTFNRRPFFIYTIKPLIWVLTAFIIYKFPKYRIESKRKYKKFLREWVIYLAFMYIAFEVFGGFIHGFGKSPYSLTLLGFLQNYVLLFGTLIGKETARAYIVNNGSKKSVYIRMVIAGILFTLINIPLYRAMQLKQSFEIVQFIGEEVLPDLCISIMATYLVYLGGPQLSFIYIGIIKGVQYISPILPNLKWITTAIIGGLCPIFSMMFLQYSYLKESKKLKRHEDKNENPAGWIVTTLAAVFIFWFSIGVFPIYPSVITTGSMKPIIKPGDMVLVRRLKIADIKVGDIVQYKKDNMYIFHRVIEVVEDKDEIKYKTKGDNNTIADSDLISIDMIKGKVIKAIPKIGWLTLIIKDSRNNVERSKVEF